MLLKSVHQKLSNIVLNMDGIDVTRTDTNNQQREKMHHSWWFFFSYKLLPKEWWRLLEVH